MRRFAHLFTEIDETTRTSEKVAAMERYFREAPPADAAWAVSFLGGYRPKRLIPARRLAGWAMEETGTPEWLFEESYDAVGDLAETIALLLPSPESESDIPLHVVLLAPKWEQALLDPLREGKVARGACVRENEGDGLGQVTDLVVTLLEQPIRYARGFGGPCAQFTRRYQTLGAPAAQEMDSPGGVHRRSAPEVLDQRSHLLVGCGGLIYRGE